MSQYRDQRIAFPVFFHRRGCTGFYRNICRPKRRKSGAEYRETIFFLIRRIYMKQKKAKMSLEKKHNLTGWAFLIPAALLIFIFCFYPMIQAIILSFTKKGSGFAGWQITREY